MEGVSIVVLSLLVSLGSSTVSGLELEDVIKRLEEMETREKTYVALISDLKESQNLQERIIRQLQDQVAEKDVYIQRIESRVIALEDELGVSEKYSWDNKHIPDIKYEGESADFEAVKFTNDARHAAGSENVSTNLTESLKLKIERSEEFATRRVRTNNGKTADLETIFPSKKRSVTADLPIAFHAVNWGGEVSHVGVNQNIVFPGEKLNLGGAYHKQHGIFIAPVAGVYVFSTSLMSHVHPHQEAVAKIVKNAERSAGVFAYGDDFKDQGSVTVTVQLAEGDEVWVQFEAPADGSYYGDYYTSFTGFLLMPILAD